VSLDRSDERSVFSGALVRMREVAEAGRLRGAGSLHSTYFLCVDRRHRAWDVDDEAFARRPVERRGRGSRSVPFSAFAEQRSVTPPGAALLREAGRDDRCRGREAMARAKELFRMSPADEAAQS
jgi:hypothetical protein